MSADDRQVGGTHYKSTYQHWTLVSLTGMGYFEGCSTKYVARYKQKNGLEDLRKARHYLQKLREDVVDGKVQPRKVNHSDVAMEVLQFGNENKIEGNELAFILILSSWTSASELSIADGLLTMIIEDASYTTKPVPLTEENHHADRIVPRRDPGLAHKPTADKLRDVASVYARDAIDAG